MYILFIWQVRTCIHICMDIYQGWTPRPVGPRPAGQRGCPAPRRKKRLLPRHAKYHCCPAPLRPWKWSNCGAFAGQNENSKTLKKPKIFTNAYGQAGYFTVSLTIKNPFGFLTTSLSSKLQISHLPKSWLVS